ncbi:glycosyltransferase family 2 protein [Zobellia galactanivorans]|uniref:glycosyltransferase family 2 protein n=1 Tax=Zobellia galactanivorans (strain DSM 12802 / CCUG 47099 / CIP 106680 / NCIMB 13871 / Dsij) TaxID=63186 RepID=UPI0026E1ED9A|nr:glycosyltransferase family 2 protein [Zobellia galactanivorans]MDO6809175.1 glycosyltransferase family 2 protein [Zobellia galactanivorans]
MHKVSIITPVYNSEQYIKKCIESVLAQSYEDWEMILCDDCSTDASVEIIRAFAEKDQRIKLITCEINGGAGVARNKAIEQAAGRFIAFLDCDDFWHKDKLKKQLRFLKDKDFAMVYSQYYIVEGEAEVPKYKICSPEKVCFKSMLRNDYVGFLTLIYDTEKLGKQYMSEIRRRQDWAYKLKLLKSGYCAYGIQEPLAFYRVGNSSLSSNKFKLIKYNFRVFHEELGNSWITSSFLMINFLCYYFYYKLVSKKKVNFKPSTS